eukprot:7317707-Prymnesium_polylepis.1
MPRETWPPGCKTSVRKFVGGRREPTVLSGDARGVNGWVRRHTRRVQSTESRRDGQRLPRPRRRVSPCTCRNSPERACYRGVCSQFSRGARSERPEEIPPTLRR